MNLLAIDTSTDKASIALLVGEEITYKEQDSAKTHAQVLLPLVDTVLADSGISLNQLEAIIFGCGPGSFTGLRIACSLAKGLAYGLDLGLIPVGSLDAIAFEVRKQHSHFQTPILALLDARMKELYWGYYEPNQLIAKPCLDAANALSLSQPSIVAGLGIELYWEDFSQEFKRNIKGQELVYPKASTMIELALKAQITAIPAETAQPHYVRNQVIQGEKHG